MLGGELIDHLRTDVLRDVAVPPLWSDALILRLLNEAQRIHARKTYSIMDTYEFTTDQPTTNSQGDLVGNGVYDLPKETLYVWSAQIDGQEMGLHNWTRRRLPSLLATSTGMPQAFTLDENIRTIRLYPVPDWLGSTDQTPGPYTILARRSIRPTQDLTPDDEPQIPEEYQLDLADFVAWRCLILPDEDGQNLVAAKEFEKLWVDHISTAKGEIYRRMVGPNPHASQNWTLSNNAVFGSGFAIR